MCGRSPRVDGVVLGTGAGAGAGASTVASGKAQRSD